MSDFENKFYIYMWYFISNNEVFYIGKGTGNRYLDVEHSRNSYFKNIINKYKDNIDVKIYKDNLTEEDAFRLERELIKEYWEKGECKANFHEGGCGGNTGNYNSEERSKKLSEAAKKRTGEKHPLYGTHRSEETKEKLHIANKGKRLSDEHKAKLILANTGRKKTQEEIEFITNLNKGKKMPKETYDKMMDSLCEYEYKVFINKELIFKCLGRTELLKYCKDNFNISRTIVDKVILGDWEPKFNKYQNLKDFQIVKIRRCID